MEATTATFSAPLERSVSQQSATSIRSHRSTTRGRKKLTSQPSSSASSIAPSDKSLTSFPSFSPDSPREERTSFFRSDNDMTPVISSRKTSGLSLATSNQEEEQGPREEQGQEQQERQEQQEQNNNKQDHLQPSTTVDHLTTTAVSPARGALFEDAPLASRKIPGALHLADDEHIERLIARHGAVNLVRQIAEDLAQRDVQIVQMRRRAEERERTLRKIVLECGLSSLDMETRLRAMEQEARSNGVSRQGSGEGLSDLVTDAMTQDLRHPLPSHIFDDATIRPSSVPLPAGPGNESARGSTRGWKDYLWGGGTVKRSGRANNTIREASKQPPAVVKATPTERRPALQEDLFNPPEEDSMRGSSRASSVNSSNASRKPSLASMALRLVAGGTPGGRDPEIRGRTSNPQERDLMRTQSSSSINTGGSARAVSSQGGPKALMAMRRPPGPIRPIDVPSRTQPPERWDTMVSTPGGDPVARQQNYGPREAAQMAGHAKKNSRAEMIHGRHGLSPVLLEDSSSGKMSLGSDGRPGTPCSSEEPREDAKPKRWQDYLKIATFPTELLSHTPLISAQGFEVMEAAETPKSPGHSPSMMSEDRGFLPSATTTAAITPSDTEIQPRSEGEQPPAATLAKEDAEPVRLLLQNLNNLHDTLQREKTVRWNDFLRKVRAERKRDGEAAAAAAAAAAEARFERATAVMPETRLGDGELIGVASLGIQGKVGRAKANEFRSLVLGGIPVASRSKIWSECCGANALRIPGYYASLMARPESSDDAQVVAQIKADITRTLTDNIFFRKGPGVQKLHDVLLAYSRRNPDVGYCQGMNLVVANLLLTILPPHYFDHSLLASRADQVVLRQYVSEVLPKLSAHFDALAIDLETMTFQWFLSLFTDCLSAEALFRVWDVVLCSPQDAAAFLFQVALALLKLNEGNLLRCESPAEVYTYINHEMTNHAISIDGLVQASEALRRLVRRDEVEVRRKGAVEGEMGVGKGMGLEVSVTVEEERAAGDSAAGERAAGESVSEAGSAGQKAGVVPAVVSQEVVMGGLSRSVSRAPSPVGEREGVEGGVGAGASNAGGGFLAPGGGVEASS
ncbi:rab-GTPase-TBC domain-containing protein [Chaetomium fimeti]|uniref:Rab-GTPase-TBC domain-containing protein n=1 Tax=Chaetomium fimeti TaxID=1854472 RepID=A0AAE0LUB2_9PEZI|nr:rab-GTPase-TBC domain-containing protein [Chaetomium fimeti]